MKLAMKLRRDMIGVAAETLNRMFQQQQDQLIEQVRFLQESLLAHVPDPMHLWNKTGIFTDPLQS